MEFAFRFIEPGAEYVLTTNPPLNPDPNHWSADFSLQQLPWNQRFRAILQTKVSAPILRFMVQCANIFEAFSPLSPLHEGEGNRLRFGKWGNWPLLARVTLLLVSAGMTEFGSTAADRELIRDPHFQGGFYLLESKPGKRVVHGQMAGRPTTKPVWDLAQWSSRFPLQPSDCIPSAQGCVCSNSAKMVMIGKPGAATADLSLAVYAATEYPRPRKSPSEPWVHLLVQQDLLDPPALSSLAACNFHLEARLKASRLASTNDYSPAIHAAQFLVYLIVANRNPNAAGYQECFWFGIPIYDNRERIVSAYEAQDFGDTKLFIFTPGADTFAPKSTHDLEWVTYEKDLLPLIRQGLEHARAKGFLKGSIDLADYRPLGIFIGWEVPGTFDVDLQIRNLSLKVTALEK